MRVKKIFFIFDTFQKNFQYFQWLILKNRTFHFFARRKKTAKHEFGGLLCIFRLPEWHF